MSAYAIQRLSEHFSDVAHERRNADRQSYTDRYERACSDLHAEISTADAEQLGEMVWSALDGVGIDSKLHLLDELMLACRDLTAVEYGDQSERRIATARVISAWRLACATAVVRIADQRMSKGA